MSNMESILGAPSPRGYRYRRRGGPAGVGPHGRTLGLVALQTGEKNDRIDPALGPLTCGAEHLFNLKFAAKELNRNSKKCDKEEKAEKAKIKKAIQKGNMEVARIHAENAIRQKNQAINFLRMSARVDAVAARVQTAVTMGKVTKSMAGVVKSMDATLKSMNLEKISALMDKFEHQFETLDVQTQQMEDTMSNTTTLTTPQNQVDMLLQEMADEAGLDLNMELPQGQTGSVGTSVASAEQDELSQRLARLRDQV
ncbi:charged multivesicular body protein 1b isoform 2-T2 [Chlamydotis macqueenii]